MKKHAFQGGLLLDGIWHYWEIAFVLVDEDKITYAV